MSEPQLLRAIEAAPNDPAPRMVYADWLEEHGDARASFVRRHMQLAPLPPDHPARFALEAKLDRRGIDAAWLAAIEPERRPTGRNDACCENWFDDTNPLAPELHREPQDVTSPGWQRLLELVDDAARTGATEFAPLNQMTAEQIADIITLPPTIAKLTSVRRLRLYGSGLVRIPTEIGDMAALELFTPYTSYGLHWFPYEITRCTALRDSTVSTRALYGNHKFRPPFPALGAPYPAVRRACSVCRRDFEDVGTHRVWISLRVATDVLPLLVNACSDACVTALPPPAKDYVPHPHRGGIDVVQPKPD